MRLSAFLSRTTKIAWITAGIRIKRHKHKFINAWNGLPANSTANGGRKIANSVSTDVRLTKKIMVDVDTHSNIISSLLFL